ncbi:MAG: HEAT repeat domain-containing protein [Planctomycetota bacterium]|jgi:HEAT repeat protein
MSPRCNKLSQIVLMITVLLLAGCAEMDPLDTGIVDLFRPDPPDQVPGVQAPAERVIAVRELGQRATKADSFEQERIAGELAAAFRSETDPLIRREIIRALGRCRSAAATLPLADALRDSDSDVRIAACQVWAERGGPDAAARLSEVFRSDTNVDVRLAAVRGLGEAGDPGAVPALGEAIEDRDPAMQYRAVNSLRRVTGKDFGNDVNRWHTYVQYLRGEAPAPPEPLSIAERFGQMF